MIARAVAKLLVLLIFPVLLLVFVWVFSERMEGLDVQSIQWTIKRIQKPAKFHPSIVLLGDSTATVNLNVTKFPLAVGLPLLNGTAVEAYFALRKYLKKNAKPECIILSLSESWPHYKIFFWRTWVRSGFYTWQDVREIHERASSLGTFPAIDIGSYRLWFYYVLYRSRIAGLTFSELQEGIFQGVPPNVNFLVSKIPELRGSVQMYRRTINPTIPQGFDAPGTTEALFDSYEDDLVSLAAEKGIKLILVPVPDLKGEAASIGPASMARQKRMQERIIRVPTNQVIREMPTFEKEDFSFDHHLLSHRANAYSQYILERINCPAATSPKRADKQTNEVSD